MLVGIEIKKMHSFEVLRLGNRKFESIKCCNEGEGRSLGLLWEPLYVLVQGTEVVD